MRHIIDTRQGALTTAPKARISKGACDASYKSGKVPLLPRGTPQCATGGKAEFRKVRGTYSPLYGALLAIDNHVLSDDDTLAYTVSCGDEVIGYSDDSLTAFAVATHLDGAATLTTNSK